MQSRLSGRQLAIMKILWARGEVSVADVVAALPIDPPLAYSTVATVLARMEKKGLVSHRADGRTFLYRARISERGVVRDLVDRIFGGSPSELVSHLLETDQVDRVELDRIKQLVRRHEALARQDRQKGSP